MATHDGGGTNQSKRSSLPPWGRIISYKGDGDSLSKRKFQSKKRKKDGYEEERKQQPNEPLGEQTSKRQKSHSNHHSSERHESFREKNNFSECHHSGENFFLCLEAFRVASSFVDRALAHCFNDSSMTNETKSQVNANVAHSKDDDNNFEEFRVREDEVEFQLAKEIKNFFQTVAPENSGTFIWTENSLTDNIKPSSTKRHQNNSHCKDIQKPHFTHTRLDIFPTIEDISVSNSSSHGSNISPRNMEIVNDKHATRIERNVVSQNDSEPFVFEQDDFTPSTAYQPFIVPVANVHCPPSTLDRNWISFLLQQNFFFEPNKTKRTRQAVCTLRGTYFSAESSYPLERHGDMIQEIVRQCLAQDPEWRNKISLETTNPKIKFPQYHFSYETMLVDWAKSTINFDSVVIILEKPELIPQSTLKSFMQSMVRFRVLWNFPVSVVSLAIRRLSSNRVSDVFDVSTQSKDFYVIPSSTAFDQFMDRLYRNDNFELDLPVLLGKRVLRTIKEVFADNFGSVVQAAIHMKMALSHHFSKPGSFVSMTYCPVYMNRHWGMQAWFCVEKNARQWTTLHLPSTSGLSSLVTGEQMVWHVYEAYHQRLLFVLIRHWLDTAIQHFLSSPQQAYVSSFDGATTETLLTDAPSFNVTIDKIRKSALSSGPSSLQNLLRLLGQWKQIATNTMSREKKNQLNAPSYCLFCEYTGTRRYVSTPISHIIFELNNHIKRLGAALHDDEGDDDIRGFVLSSVVDFVTNVLRGSLFQRNCHVSVIHYDKKIPKEHLSCISMADYTVNCLGTAKNVKTNNLLFSSFFVMDDDDGDFSHSMETQSRRHVSMELLENEDSTTTNDTDDSLFYSDLCLAFQLMENRYIGTDDWYQSFAAQAIAQSDGRNSLTLWQRFVFAVYQMIHCGWIVRTSRSADMFEKVAMVWTSR